MPQNKFDTKAMDSLLSKAVASEEVIGVSALVYDDGETVYTGAFGLRDRENNKPVTHDTCLLYTSPSPRDRQKSRMPSSA